MNLRPWLGAGLMLLACLAGGAARAHEVMPASLEVNETTTGTFAVRWRIPAQQGVAPRIQPRFPDDCTALAAPHIEFLPGARLAEWTLSCNRALRDGAVIAFEGQELTLIDVLVRIAYADGTHYTAITHPQQPMVTPAPPSQSAPGVPAYARLGVEHILGGVDHLLFVACLVLLVPGWWPLLRTITAFTLAHSLTLALSTLGVVQLPARAVEACIALSILYCAATLARNGMQAGARSGPAWRMAFVFGLLHGFGFAGALAQIGLPQDDIPAALLMFNVGVEIGQLLFVALLLAAIALLRRLRSAWPRWLAAMPVYAIGGVAACWWWQRAISIFQ